MYFFIVSTIIVLNEHFFACYILNGWLLTLLILWERIKAKSFNEGLFANSVISNQGHFETIIRKRIIFTRWNKRSLFHVVGQLFYISKIQFAAKIPIRKRASEDVHMVLADLWLNVIQV
jgi:hypothetical protein